MAASPDPDVSLIGILQDVRAYVTRYVVLSNEQVDLLTLWAAHTHAIEAADCTPYMQVTSATAEAGKTRLLEVLNLIVARPWLTQRVSAAALVRKIDGESPTLLLDESDAAFAGEKEYAEALRGLLNSGYRRSGRSTLCIGQGANLTYRDFATFSAKMIAGIGKLPDTVASRAIRIELRRRTKTEPVAKFRERDSHAEADPIQSALAAWAPTAVPRLRDARPDMPSGLRDRAEDVIEPLLAIADLAGGMWPTDARRAALTLMGTPVEQDINVDLLHDVHAIFDELHTEFITTKDLIARLVGREDRPWADWSKGRPISGRAVADRLKGFGVIPMSNGVARGYHRDRFLDAWTRYPASNPSTHQNPNESGPDPAVSTRQRSLLTDDSEGAKAAMNPGLDDGLTVQIPDTEASGEPPPLPTTRWAGRVPDPDDPPFGISRTAWARHQSGLH